MARTCIRSDGKECATSEKILVCGLATTGYPSVDLRKTRGGKKTIYVHALVAAAFIGSRPEGCDVMHIDGGRTNNRIENLRYGSRSCNFAFMVDDGTAQQGESHKHAKLTNDKVRRIREFSAVGCSRQEIAAAFGVHRRTISDVVRGKTWGHMGA